VSAEGRPGTGPGASSREARFPEVEGRSLEGRRLDLPGDFGNGLNVAAIAFHRRHQKDVDSWAADFKALENDFGIATWEIPTISGRWGPARRFIDGGMASAITDRKTRARTVTVYGNTNRMTRALGLSDREQIAVVLCEPSGSVHWIGHGARSAAAAVALREAASSAAGTS
jgi:hypothetical protein